MPVAAEHDLGALRARVVHVRDDLVESLPVDQRADVDTGLRADAHAQGGDRLRVALHERVVDAVLHEQAVGGDADDAVAMWNVSAGDWATDDARVPALRTIRRMAALGHVEVDWSSGRWGALDPAITLLPDAGGYGLVVGARTARFTRDLMEDA
mgnify:CR=1 FL=1